MNSAKLNTISKSLFLCAALTANTSAQTNTVNVIFAAENALYGAGYNIGRADGWIDTALRQSVRDYQTRNKALKVSGVLDVDTLSALGVSNSSGQAVSENVVASKAEALAALGISDFQPQPQPKAQPQRRLQAKPAFSLEEIAPEPAAAVVAEKSHARTQPQFSNTADAVTPKPVPEPTVTSPTEAVTASAPLPSVLKTEPASQTDDKPAPSTDVAKVVSPTPETEQSTSAETVAWMKQLPGESTANGQSDEQPADEVAAQVPKADHSDTSTDQLAQKKQPAEPKSDRNIFGSLIHFLFGWMV